MSVVVPGPRRSPAWTCARTSPAYRRTRSVLAVVVGLCITSTVLVSCGADGGDAAATPTTAIVRKVPNLVGTWGGKYEFPSKGKVIPTALNLVIERQEGVNLFGYESFVDSSGETIKFDLVGTVNIDPIDGEAEAVMATTGFFFDIEVIDADHLAARFVRTDDKPTTFFVNLTRQT